MKARRPILVLALAAFASALPVAAVDGGLPVVRFEVERGPVMTNEGHVTLAWSPDSEPAAPGDLRFEVQLVRSDTFDGPERRYLGGNRSHFVAGLEEGSHWFRVRAVDGEDRGGPWSEELEVDVTYPEARQVVWLMIVGAIVLIATVAMIVIGHRRTETAAGREGSS